MSVGCDGENDYGDDDAVAAAVGFVGLFDCVDCVDAQK